MNIQYTLYSLLLISFLSSCKTIQYDQKAEDDYEEPVSEMNSNNLIYKDGTELLYDYYFLKGNDTLKCQVLGNIPKPESLSRLVSIKDTVNETNIIEQVEIKATGRLFFKAQTEISFNLLSRDKKPMLYAQTWTGVVENKFKVWTHPTRMYQFAILEFNPFPEIKFPLQKNMTWVDTIKAYPFANYDEWIKFDKRINCISVYKIKGTTNLKTKLGELKCYVVEGTATTPMSKGYLTTYFNEQYGFVKLDYTNIDGNKLIMDMVSFKRLPPN